MKLLPLRSDSLSRLCLMVPLISVMDRSKSTDLYGGHGDGPCNTFVIEYSGFLLPGV